MTNLRCLLAGAVVAVALVAPAAPAGAAAGADEPGVLRVQTVPPLAGARVAADGIIGTTDSKGRAELPISTFQNLKSRFHVLESRVGPLRKVVSDKILGNPDHGASGRPLVVGLRTFRLVRCEFSNRTGGSVAPERITLVQLRSSTGEILRLRGAAIGKPFWVLTSRTQQVPNGLVSKDIYWVVDRIVVDGADVVNRAQNRFVPNDVTTWTVQLLFYRVQVSARDALFGFPTGRDVQIIRPDGKVMKARLDDRGEVTLPLLPRGGYEVTVSGGGTSFRRPVSISKDQTLDLAVLSYLDISMIAGTLLVTGLSLLLLGRRRHLRDYVSQHRRRRRRDRTERPVTPVGASVLAVALALGVPGTGSVSGLGGPETARARTTADVPVLAYYYIWFQPTSWQRAKSDLPLLGRYSSDDAQVMRAHVRLAKDAGIDGFLVSWKHLPHLDRRLEQLVKIADELDFKLSVVYQGLDFRRDPLPAELVRDDLRYFADQFSRHPAFQIFDRPTVVWTGTEKFSAAEIQEAVDPIRGRLDVLSSAKSVADYERTADLVAGNAYYWSSVDPRVDTFQGAKLAGMGAAVHDHDGLWIAPAAGGYDSRLLGGHRVVPREGGRTLRRQMAVAAASSPDAVGLISWNEFSENSHIEPSEKYGDRAIQTVADVLGVRSSISVPARPRSETLGKSGITGFGALVLLILSVALINVLVAFRQRTRPPPEPVAAPLAFVRSRKVDRP